MRDFFTDINWDRWSETAWTHGVRIGDAGIEVRVLGDTLPGRQWDAMRELRRRLKDSLDAEGIQAGILS